MIARVFPRRTKATPIDEYAFIGEPGLFIPDDITEIHVSVAFTWDIPLAERLARIWRRYAPVKIGGPAYGDQGGEFVPGMYLKKGNVITSRGCNNNCWFCLVPKREGKLRELPIAEGNNLLDNNILGCSEGHIRSVFKMLQSQPKVKLTGGLEAKLLRPWHVELFEQTAVQDAFFAYDSADDLPPLEAASQILLQSPWYRVGKARCYVLCGYQGDTIQKAEQRCITALRLGFYPFAMFYFDPEGKQHKNKAWTQFQQSWTRPAAINATRKKLFS